MDFDPKEMKHQTWPLVMQILSTADAVRPLVDQILSKFDPAILASAAKRLVSNEMSSTRSVCPQIDDLSEVRRLSEFGTLVLSEQTCCSIWCPSTECSSAA